MVGWLVREDQAKMWPFWLCGVVGHCMGTLVTQRDSIGYHVRERNDVNVRRWSFCRVPLGLYFDEDM